MPEPDPSSDSAAFAAHLLHAALVAPGTESVGAGVTVATLLGVLVAEGAAGEVASVMTTAPGASATFEVDIYSFASIGPEVAVTGLDAGDALKEALRRAEDSTDLVEIVAADPDGLTRRVLECRQGQRPRFLFPGAATYEGEPAQIERALDAWAREQPPVSVAPEGSVDATGTVGGSGPAISEAAPSGLARTLQGPNVAAGEQDDAVTDLLRRTVREALEEVTVEVDLGAIEAVVAAALGQMVTDEHGESRPAPAAERAAPAEHAVLDPALAERIAAALERPTAAQSSIDAGLAKRIVAALEKPAERLALPAAAPSATDIARELAGDLPGAATIAEEVLARLHSVGTFGDREPAPPRGTGTTTVALVSAAEQLRLQTQMFEDRVRAATRALEALADDVAANARGTEDYLGRLTQSVTATVDRLGRRLEGRLDRWPSGRPADGAGLTARLEATVDDSDEGVVRLHPR